MENPTPPPSSINDELKIKPMLKEYTPVTAIIKGGFVDESISSRSAEIFTNFMNSILKHNQSSLIERVVDKRPPPPRLANKIKTNMAPMTLQSEPSSVFSIPEPPLSEPPLHTPSPNPSPSPEVGGHKRRRTSKQAVKTQTQSKKNKKVII
jgi:hypothetical protein